jgi:hypothetical protein
LLPSTEKKKSSPPIHKVPGAEYNI